MAAEPERLIRFACSKELFEALVATMGNGVALSCSHAELETMVVELGRELLRQVLQDNLDLRSAGEERLDAVVDAAGIDRPRAEAGHVRQLQTVLGTVEVNRIAYRRPGQENLHPADAGLNLPTERYSHGLRALAAVEASRGSFDDAVAAIEGATGQKVGKRQVEALAAAAASDFDDFYATRKPASADPGDLVVLSADGKGIVMRPEALRPATARAAKDAKAKLSTRLSKGEKRNRKRMAELAAVYDAKPAPRTPGDILAGQGGQRPADTPAPVTPGPKAKAKVLFASVVNSAATVIAQAFDEAERRDPGHLRSWVGLVDGNREQIAAMNAEAKTRGVSITIVIDFIHVLEYLWKAAWCFYGEGDPAAEAWVRQLAHGVLASNATVVAGIIRRRATRGGLEADKRTGADACAKYLTNKSPYLDYARALKEGLPIATGVIEGACRHLVADRMALTGARWGLEGAEAVLQLRALRSNGDWEAYYQFHQQQELERVHHSRYANGVIPQAA